MKTLQIEWRHFDTSGQTCDRCSATGSSIKAVISEMTSEMAENGITLTFTETLLSKERMAESNLLLIDGVPLENLLDDAVADENHCPSCSCLTGSETSCRTVEYEGKTYEDIPKDLIRKAVSRAAERILV